MILYLEGKIIYEQFFDNQSKWAWDIDKDHVVVTTDHGSHTHSLNVTKIPIGDMVTKTGKIMGDLHRSVPHDFKVPEKEAQMSNDFRESLKVDAETQAKLLKVSKEAQSNATKKASDDSGGRERGDEGPRNHGRDSALKNTQNTKIQSMQLGALNVNSNSSKVNSMQPGSLSRLDANGEAINNSTRANIVIKSELNHTSKGNTLGGHEGNCSGNHSSSKGGHSGTSGSHGSSSGGHGGSSGGHGGSSGGHGSSSGGHGGSSGGHGGHK